MISSLIASNFFSDLMSGLLANSIVAFFAVRYFESTEAERHRKYRNLSVLNTHVERYIGIYEIEQRHMNTKDKGYRPHWLDFRNEDNEFYNLKDNLYFWKFKGADFLEKLYNDILIRIKKSQEYEESHDQAKTNIDLLIDNLRKLSEEIKKEMS